MAKTFPIMQLPNYARGGSTVDQLQSAGALFAVVGVPWDLMLKHERQALKNHDQTIARLAERGGLSASEAIAVLNDRDYLPMAEALAHAGLGQIIRAAAVDAAIEAARLPSSDWPPSGAASLYAEGSRLYGSTGQLFEVKAGQWIRVVDAPTPVEG